MINNLIYFIIIINKLYSKIIQHFFCKKFEFLYWLNITMTISLIKIRIQVKERYRDCSNG
jgi:hypothetical protein